MRPIVAGNRQTRVVDWLNARLTIIFILILVLFFLGAAVSVYAFNTQRRLDDQKLLLRESADGILQAMVDQQSSLRDYIGSNNQVFLTPFRQGHSAYLLAVQNISSQLQSGSYRHTFVDLTTVQETSDDWYSKYATIQIDKMQAGDLAGPRSQENMLKGTTLFERSRASILALHTTIVQDLAGYQDQVDTINLVLLFAGLALAIIANIAFLLLLRVFTKKLRTQIVSLTHTTERLAEGEQGVRVSTLPFTDLDQVGRSINFMADAIELHEQALEESLHILEEQFALVERAQSESRAIFDASSEAFLFVSSDGQVRSINRPFREFFALSAEEVVGTPLVDLRPQLEQRLINIASFYADLVQDSTNQERRYTTTIIQKVPQYRELVVSSTPVPGSTNAYLGRLYVMRDVTREREMERLKAEFNALISHGLRSPLTSIKGYTDLLLDQQEEAGPLNELQREFLEIVQNNTRRLLALVNDLLDMSRLEAQTMKINPISLDLHTLIREVVRSMRPQIEERRQRLSLNFTPFPLFVLGDENRVGQILTNLMTFATNHTPVGGRIDWQTQQEDTMVRITCFGSGQIAAEDVAAFTRPFFHDPVHATPGALGSVLGPSITRSLVELHGGTLQASAQAEDGYSFSFTLPLSSSEAVANGTTAHVL